MQITKELLDTKIFWSFQLIGMLCWFYYFQNQSGLFFFFPLMTLSVFLGFSLIGKYISFFQILNVLARYTLEFGGFIVWAIYFWEWGFFKSFQPLLFSLGFGALAGLVSGFLGKDSYIAKFIFTGGSVVTGYMCSYGWVMYLQL